MPQTRTAKLYRESCAWLSASQGLLSPLCRTSTSNAVKAELLKSSKIQLTPVTIFSVYCHLASASGAWWQRLKDWGGASSLRPSGSLTQTLFHKHLQDPLLTVNILTFSLLLLYVQYPEQPVCTSLLFTLLFIKSQYTVFLFLHILLFFAHLIVLHFFYFIAHFTLISHLLTICMPLCCVTLYNLYSYYFALSTERTWFDYISLLIIPCITIMWQIKKPWTLIKRK